MKKIIITTILSVSSLMLFAGVAPEYDFSSNNAFNASLLKQGAKEGFSERATSEIFKNYRLNMRMKNEPEINAFMLNLLKVKMANKSLSELMGVEGKGDATYDFSSLENFTKSISTQAEKEGMSKKDAMGLLEKLCNAEADLYLLELIENDIKAKTISDLKKDFEEAVVLSEKLQKILTLKNTMMKTSNKRLFLDIHSKIKVLVGAYDISSAKAFAESIKKQAVIENFPEAKAEDILNELLYILLKENKDALEGKDGFKKRIFIRKLLDEKIGNKSIREIEFEIDKI